MGHLAVTLVDENPVTLHDVARLVTGVGGDVLSRDGNVLTVEAPPESERSNGARHAQCVARLDKSPLVRSVENVSAKPSKPAKKAAKET